MKKFLAIVLCLSCGFVLPASYAQNTAFLANRQQMSILPGKVSNLSVVDGELYCYASSVLLKVQRNGGEILGFISDTAFAKLDDAMEYVVRHPGTDDLYFTKRDRKGCSYLYRVVWDGKKTSSKLVRMGAGSFLDKGMTVEHPTFSTDGRIMVFSSADRSRNKKNYDLWYSLFDGEGWRKPVNLGKRINTTADEVDPAIYYDYLLFSSNGYKEDNGKMSIYATRLLSRRVEGDTVGMLQIGRGRVQRLPEPINSTEAYNHSMVSDTSIEYGYWLSSRSMDAPQFYSFCGSLDGVLLWGHVVDQYDQILSGVEISVKQGDETICTTVSDNDGFYRLYLRSNHRYDLVCRYENYFTGLESVSTDRNDAELLITETRKDIHLDRLPVGERIYYEDLFGPNADIELSARGIELLSPLVRFLNDNPAAILQMSMANDLTADRVFNSLLTDRRIESLKAYLAPLLPASTSFSVYNACSGKEGCANASGLSRLTVIINKEN